MRELDMYVIAKSVPEECSPYLVNIRNEHGRVVLTYNDYTSIFDFTLGWIDGHVGFNLIPTERTNIISFQAIGHVVLMAESVEKCCKLIEEITLASMETDGDLKS